MHGFPKSQDIDLEISALPQSAVGANKVKESGWGRPQLAYSVSKALMNGFTQVLAKENDSVLINACCPG